MLQAVAGGDMLMQVPRIQEVQGEMVLVEQVQVEQSLREEMLVIILEVVEEDHLTVVDPLQDLVVPVS